MTTGVFQLKMIFITDNISEIHIYKKIWHEMKNGLCNIYNLYIQSIYKLFTFVERAGSKNKIHENIQFNK